MRKALVGVSSLMLGVSLLLTSCNSKGASNSDHTGSQTTATANTATGGTTRHDSDGQGKDGTPNPTYKPSAKLLDAANPCFVANTGGALEAEYGGQWTTTDSDEPAFSGTHYKRICTYSANVPGMYNGNTGPAPVTISVVTYVDDGKGSYFDELVKQAKAAGKYLPAHDAVDGSPGADAFYSGTPGHAALTSRHLSVIIQLVPVSDKYDVTVNDVDHQASLANEMYHMVARVIENYDYDSAG